MLFRLFGFLFLAAALANPALATDESVSHTVLFGRLITGKGEVLRNALVSIRGNQIVSVRGNYRGPADRWLPDYTAMPGLIDLHTHITYTIDVTVDPPRWIEPSERMIYAQANAFRTLQAGVTTIRDLGTVYFADTAMARAIEAGETQKSKYLPTLIGPRIFCSGYGLSSRAHAHFDGWLQGPWVMEPGLVQGREEIKKAILNNIDMGAKVVKMWATTGGYNDVTDAPLFSQEEIAAAVEIAHEAGKKISIHSYGPVTARHAVLAGADTIEHATDIDDETLDLMAMKGTIYVPTVDHNRYYMENRDVFDWFSDEDVVKMEAYLQRNLQTVARARAKGVKIGMGSDALFTMFGQNAYELAQLVRAGLTPQEAIDSATKVGAQALGESDKLGAVAPGYFADISAFRGNPLEDINVILHAPRWVMKNGHLVYHGLAPKHLRPKPKVKPMALPLSMRLDPVIASHLHLHAH